MAYVELNRAFQPIPKDQEASVDAGRYWGRALGSWMEWPELREYRRVVLLAEASSGKSEEFRNQTVALAQLSKAAFFLRIEELADQGFSAALDAQAARLFEQWRNGTEDAWFFLDSVDEARLNQKRLETALKRFTRELDQSLERAHIFISCRVSDWKGRDDRAIIERLLPSWEKAAEPSAEVKTNPLLDPVFKEKSKTEPIQRKRERKVHELLVVQLHPLTNEQCELLAGAEGVSKPSEFMTEIREKGLDAFTERPGDVLDLASYWNSYGKFGSLSDMVEHAVGHKLEEREKDRPDNSVLSVEKARKGAERIAAALTLGKSFTVLRKKARSRRGLMPPPFHPGSPATRPLRRNGTTSSRTLRLGFAPPETGDKDFLIVECDCDKEFLISGIPIAGDGRSVALGPAASPLLRVRRFARPSAADRPGVPALPASR